MIATDVLDDEEADEDFSIDNYGAALDEEDESALGETYVITGVTESVTEEVEEVQQVLKYDSTYYYMLKLTSLLTKGFNNSNKAKEKLFSHMYNFGARSEWRNERRAVSSYLDVDTGNYQYHLVNPTLLG